VAAKTLATGVAFLAVLDLITTRLVLALGGIEGNPLMVAVAGNWWGVVVKLVVTPLLLWFMVWYGTRHAPQTTLVVLTVALTVYSVVVANNILVVRELV